jgi:cell wall-associated NlpC family hydrolase
MTAQIDPDLFFPRGAMFLTQIEGWTGRWVGAAQAFVRGGSYWTHAGICLGDGLLLEGQPGGAVVTDARRLLDGRPLLVSDDPMRRWLEANPEAYGPQTEILKRAQVADVAMTLVGTPYSYLDYLALTAVEARFPGAGALRRYVESSGHLICSALVDRVYSRSGIELFDDERYAGDVTPGDLDRWVQVARNGVHNPAERTLRNA